MNDSPEITDLASFVNKHPKLLIISVVIIIIVALIATVTFLIFDRQAKYQAELWYWENIKQQPTDDLYCKYLEKYPKGEFKDIAVVKLDGRFCGALRYKANEDGLVEDTKTGLKWMRCAIGQEWDGKTCDGDPTEMTWEEAVSIPKNFRYASHNDWRVPTTDELMTIASNIYSVRNVKSTTIRCLDRITEQVFTPSRGYSFKCYWSSTPPSKEEIDEDYRRDKTISFLSEQPEFKYSVLLVR